MGYYVSEALCPQSHTCPMMAECPVDAISQEGFNLPVIDQDECIECGKCAMICGKKAVKYED